MKELIQTISGFIEDYSAESGVSGGLAAAYIVVCILIVIMAVVCLVMKLIIWIRYARANKQPISSQMSGMDAARFVLDREGLDYVKVRKAGLIREALFGNYYNIYTKTIYLRSVLGKIDNKKTVTSTALAVQKAGLASLCENGDTQAVLRNRLHLIGVFGPLLFIPLLIGGAVLDFAVLHTDGLVTQGTLALSGLFLVLGFIVTFLNIPVEKRANEEALQMMRETGLANEEELAVMKKVYDTYIISYICDFILELLRIIQWVLEIVMKSQSKNHK